MTLDLEQIKLRLESLNKRRPGHLTPDECSRLLPIFSDLIEEVERLQEEDKAGDKIIEDLGNDIERLKADYEGACKTVAEMHAAAVGEIRGPTRGVVEDVLNLRQQNSELEAQVCQLREALENLLREYEGKWSDDPSSVKAARQALASTPGCGHEELIKELETLEGTCPTCGMQQVKISDGPLCHCMAEAKPHLPHTQND